MKVCGLKTLSQNKVKGSRALLSYQIQFRATTSNWALGQTLYLKSLNPVDIGGFNV